MIAKELYRLLRKVEAIEKQIESAPAEKQEELINQLRQIKADKDRVRNILEGKKG
jgi:hypothetical protein